MLLAGAVMTVGVQPVLAAAPLPRDSTWHQWSRAEPQEIRNPIISDVNGASLPLAFSLGTPQHGSVVLDGPSTCEGTFYCLQFVVYTSVAGFVGTDTFDFTVTDAADQVGTGTVTVTFIEDTDAPSGLFDLAADWGVGFTNSLTVAAQVSASDPTSGVDKVRLSNSGAKVEGLLTTYQEFSYPGTENISWTLSNATGGSTAVGTHRVWAQYGDAGGNWSPIYFDNIWYDPTAPVVTALKLDLPATTFGYTSVLGQLTWTIKDIGGSGIGPLGTLQVSKNGRAWQTITSIISGTNVGLDLVPGVSYRFRLRVRDRAGNLSAWRTSVATKAFSYPETSGAIKYAGSWGTTYYVSAGTVTRHSTSFGSSASLTFKGRSVGWLSVKGPGRGKANVYLDGRLITTVKLYSSTTRRFQMVFRKSYASVGTHTLRISVAGSKKVEIDNLYVLR